MPFVNQQYIDYIRSREWKAKRIQVLLRDQFICQVCFHAKASQVHHKTYIRLYQELPEDLISICTPCHRLITKAHRSSPSLKSAPTIFMWSGNYPDTWSKSYQNMIKVMFFSIFKILPLWYRWKTIRSAGMQRWQPTGARWWNAQRGQTEYRSGAPLFLTLNYENSPALLFFWFLGTRSPGRIAWS